MSVPNLAATAGPALANQQVPDRSSILLAYGFMPHGVSELLVADLYPQEHE
jgi:hypothetical protein